MNTTANDTIAVQVDPKTGLHYTEQREEGADYVTVTEYIRRHHKAALEKDPQAKPLYDTSLRKVMKRGEILVLKQGAHFFIDWNKYKGYVFVQYMQRPKVK